MSTDKHALEITTEKVNESYEASYVPLFPVLTKQKKYTEVIGEVKLKESNIIGDAKARKINAQDTEWKHAKSGTSEKKFNKYFSGIKFIVSGFQDNTDFQKHADELLDINMMEFDKNVFYGDPTSDGTLRNNGMYASDDPNFITNAIEALGANPTVDQIKELFDALIFQSEQTVGNVAKTIILVGEMAKKLGRFVPNTATSFARAIAASYQDEGKQITIEGAPSNLTAETNDSGILLLTPSKVEFDYTTLPKIDDQGYNAEDKYTWLNLIYGSATVDVQKKGALIKQPVSFS